MYVARFFLYYIYIIIYYVSLLYRQLEKYKQTIILDTIINLTIGSDCEGYAHCQTSYYNLLYTVSTRQHVSSIIPWL